jgi:hypothetical protein
MDLQKKSIGIQFQINIIQVIQIVIKMITKVLFKNKNYKRKL